MAPIPGMSVFVKLLIIIVYWENFSLVGNLTPAIPATEKPTRIQGLNRNLEQLVSQILFCFCKQIFPPIYKLEILECCVHMLFLSSGNLAVIIISILICECCYNANYHCVFFKQEIFSVHVDILNWSIQGKYKCHKIYTYLMKYCYCVIWGVQHTPSPWTQFFWLCYSEAGYRVYED